MSIILVSDLPEGNQYGIQIIAVSYDDQQAISEKVGVSIPEYRKVQAISTGIIAGLALLVIVFSVFYYLKSRCWKQKQKEQMLEKNGKHNLY